MEYIKLDPFLSQFKTCIIKVLQMQEILNLSNLSIPFLLNKVAPGLNSSVITKHQVSSTPLKTFKARNLRCTVAAIAVGNLDLKNVTKEAREGIDNFIYETKRLRSQRPKMVVVFQKDAHTSRLSYNIALHVQNVHTYIPVFVLFPVGVQKTNNRFSGYFLPSFSESTIKFDCFVDACLRVMESVFDNTTNFGLKMQWKYDTMAWYQEWYRKHVRSPFDRKDHWNLSITVYFVLVQILDTNFTVNGMFGLGCLELLPTAFIGVGGSDYKMQEWRVTHFSRFNFITSDSVKAASLELSLYTKPFEILVWQEATLPFLRMMILGGLAPKPIWLATRFAAFQRRGTFSMDDMKSLFSEKLTAPKTALVVFSHALKFYWERVRTAQQQQRTKYAHNGKTTNDGFLRMSMSLYVTEWYDEKYNHVGKRAGNLMSSGLFWFWEKWDKIRFPQDLPVGRNYSAIIEPPVCPLSMDSSLVLSLYALFVANLLSLSILLLESSICISLMDAKYRKLEPVLYNLKNCVIKVLQLQETLDLSKLSALLLLNGFAPSRNTSVGAITNSIKTTRRVFKAQNLRCTVATVEIGSPGYKRAAKDGFGKYVYVTLCLDGQTPKMFLIVLQDGGCERSTFLCQFLRYFHVMYKIMTPRYQDTYYPGIQENATSNFTTTWTPARKSCKTYLMILQNSGGKC
ncbi:unnamed protein product [Allacma fusca]|uniref:Uncharacterized protein n=1 Tax=Allacma fusca TaxID=39272 RepID=A0A8J2KEJ6_9HEXA|nr:unnamed protein product [Allacma fusca]